jgi:hypothetical protein
MGAASSSFVAFSAPTAMHEFDEVPGLSGLAQRTFSEVAATAASEQSLFLGSSQYAFNSLASSLLSPLAALHSSV